jgi:hypothetical protein
MNLLWKRTHRTASSERFLAQREGKDVAAVSDILTFGRRAPLSRKRNEPS